MQVKTLLFWGRKIAEFCPQKHYSEAALKRQQMVETKVAAAAPSPYSLHFIY